MIFNTHFVAFCVLFCHVQMRSFAANLYGNKNDNTEIMCSPVPELTFDDVINDVMVLERPIRAFQLDNTWSCLKECMKMFPLCDAINLNPGESVCKLFRVHGKPVFEYEERSIYYGVKGKIEVKV